MTDNPVRGASIAVIKENHVLLVLRGQGAWQNCWSLPGGHIEETESPAEAALRELREETQVTAQGIIMIDEIDIILPDKHYILSVFAGLWKEGIASAGGDAVDVGWFSPDTLDKIPATPNLGSIIEKAFSQLINI